VVVYDNVTVNIRSQMNEMQESQLNDNKLENVVSFQRMRITELQITNIKKKQVVVYDNANVNVTSMNNGDVLLTVTRRKVNWMT